MPGRTSRAVHRILPPNPRQAAIVVTGFTLLLYLTELIDAVLPVDLVRRFGIAPRSVSGLDGIFWAPLLHNGWAHLLSNTLPVLVCGFLAMAGGLGQWIAVTATIWLGSGIGVWLTGGGVTVGASGLAFGWLAFLLVRGLFTRNVLQLGLAVVLFLYWGGTLLGMLPGRPGISWQGHLFGAAAGVLAAWLVTVAARRADRRADTRAATPIAPSTGSVAG